MRGVVENHGGARREAARGAEADRAWADWRYAAQRVVMRGGG